MIPRIPLEHLKISRLICGTNPFVGISHHGLRGLKFRIHYRKVERIEEIMLYLAQEHGINACISSPRDNIAHAIKTVERETGQDFYWICSPSRRITAKGLKPNIYTQIQWCADHQVSVCAPHRNYTDKALNRDKRIIEGVEDILASIRDKGMITGLTCHSAEIVRIVEERKYDVPIVVQPLNPLGYQSNVPPSELIKIIQNTKLQILVIKPMAAGRITPEIGLSYAFKHIKPSDFVSCGFNNFAAAKYDLSIVEKLLN